MKRTILSLALLLSALVAAAQSEALSHLIDEAEQATWHTGICIWDLTDDSLLLGYHERQLMRPASTQKVITAVCALTQLDKEHPFRTRVYCTGSLGADSILHGDVRIIGGYDPLLSLADVKSMARAIKAVGIDSIDGNIIADVSMTEYKYLGNGWCWDDVPSDVVPYLSPLFFNHQLPIDTPKGKHIQNPESYLLEVLQGELRSIGVGLQMAAGRVVTESVLIDGDPCYEQRRSLEQVLQLMMKKSDNLHAEAVFFQLAAQGKRQHATWEDAADAMESTLMEAGAEPESFDIADGSGLSLYNYVSPLTMVRMLRYAYRRPAIYAALYPALPIAGVDGTLERRMKGTKAAGNVHAKTGTVSGVSTLAGYVTAPNGHQLAFVIMLNGASSQKEARAFQDKLCVALASPTP